VRTVGVVVLDIDQKDLLEVATPDDQPVQALNPHRPDPAFRMGVRVRAAATTIAAASSMPATTVG
jgi:hypothetical protein